MPSVQPTPLYPRRDQMAPFTPEDLGYWFFRLNGCLSIRNFVVHPESKGSQKTDSDLLAVRFPFRREQDMADHPFFQSQSKTTAMFVEMKPGKCEFNGPWTRPGDRNLVRVLEAVGVVADDEVDAAAEDLYVRGLHRSRDIDIVLVALGSEENDAVSKSLPYAHQITWRSVLDFVFYRFTMYRARKAHHPQWDMSGRHLYALAIASRHSPAVFADRAAHDYAVRHAQRE